MYQEITNEIKMLKLKKFTGKIKFGIENGKVVSITINTFFEPPTQLVSRDYEVELRELIDDSYYGFIECGLFKGEIKSLNWQKSFQGEILKKKLEDSKCRSARIVVRKLSISQVEMQ